MAKLMLCCLFAVKVKARKYSCFQPKLCWRLIQFEVNADASAGGEFCELCNKQ